MSPRIAEKWTAKVPTSDVRRAEGARDGVETRQLVLIFRREQSQCDSHGPRNRLTSCHCCFATTVVDDLDACVSNCFDESLARRNLFVSTLRSYESATTHTLGRF